LVLGNGGREHALVRALSLDESVTQVFAAPGNPGTAQLATNYPVDILDGAAVAALAVRLEGDLVIVGPEAPLVAGVADAVRNAGIACFGPSGEAAQLEGSKAFAKQIMAEAGVPTAASFVCTTAEEASAALDAFGAPYVVKDDGLAGGKGVVVTSNRDEALAHAVSCERVVIEEYLDGPEVSLFVITDGVHALPLSAAQDFKRVGDGDTGPNTGGMGAYCPLPWAPADLQDQVLKRVALPVIARMAERGTPFAGLLYCGLALTSRGLRVVEFNARFGDPETEVILPLLTSPLGNTLYRAATGALVADEQLSWKGEAGVGVVLAANGYPGEPEKGGTIKLPPDTDRVHVIHAGTANVDGQLVAAGGRVLVVVATGADTEAARVAAYEHISRIDYPGGFNRSDIASAARLSGIAATLKGGQL
jgi:phosphoribosylamine--glycine ligase